MPDSSPQEERSISRRSILKLGVLGAAGTVLAACAKPPPKEGPPTEIPPTPILPKKTFDDVLDEISHFSTDIKQGEGIISAINRDIQARLGEGFTIDMFPGNGIIVIRKDGCPIYFDDTFALINSGVVNLPAVQHGDKVYWADREDVYKLVKTVDGEMIVRAWKDVDSNNQTVTTKVSAIGEQYDMPVIYELRTWIGSINDKPQNNIFNAWLVDLSQFKPDFGTVTAQEFNGLFSWGVTSSKILEQLTSPQAPPSLP